MVSAGETLPVVPGFLERLADPERWLPAVVEVLVWFSVPTIMVLVMAGIGFLVVRGGNSPSTVVHAAVAGALLLIAAVTATNFFIPLPRLTSVVVAVIGLAVFAREIRRRGVARTDLMNLSGVLAGGSALYRLRMGSTVGYDTFLYHGPVVEWLAREPLPQGLALLHRRLGNGNGLMLLMGAFRSPLGDWSHHALVEAAVVGLGFAALAACLGAAREARDAWASAFSLALAAVGALYFMIASHEPGNDHAVAYILIAATAFAVRAVREGVRCEPQVFGGLLLLVTFAFVQKSTAMPSILLLLALLWMRRDWSARLDIVRSNMPSALLVLAVGALTTARTFVATGCLAFPLAPSCVGVSWGTGREGAAEALIGDRSWARNWGAGPVTSTWDTSWITGWSSTYFASAAVRVVVIGGVVGAIASVIGPRGKASTRPPSIIILYVATGGALWFIGAPDPRFALHLHLVVAALLLAPAARLALKTAASRVTRASVPARTGTALMLVALAIVSGRLVYSGRTLPFESSTTADASQPLMTRALQTVDGNSSWEYFIRVDSDQCGAAFPCAPGELPSDLLIDPTGRRLRFERAGD
jgi:hypothetical protein